MERIKIVAIGNKMPKWVGEGFQEYAKRLPPDYALKLIEIPALRRTKTSAIPAILQQEGEACLAAARDAHPLIALDRQGRTFDTAQLAQTLQNWHDLSLRPAILIGGPEGLWPGCLKQAHTVWSLSALTFPHPLARIMIAEQIYRAWSILSHHPYHRA